LTPTLPIPLNTASALPVHGKLLAKSTSYSRVLATRPHTASTIIMSSAYLHGRSNLRNVRTPYRSSVNRRHNDINTVPESPPQQNTFANMLVFTMNLKCFGMPESPPEQSAFANMLVFTMNFKCFGMPESPLELIKTKTVSAIIPIYSFLPSGMGFQ